MFNKIFKYTFFCIGVALIASKEISAGEMILRGLTLQEPIVRSPIDRYISEHSDNCKLALGAGHISDRNALHVIFRDGCLYPGMQGHDEHHMHNGWYTFSAETDEAFNSDMVGNIRNADHQEQLLLNNTWHLIWDESYTPSVLSAPGLFPKILTALKENGKYIFPAFIRREEESWVTGYPDENVPSPEEFREKLTCGCKFNSFESLREFITSNFKSIGFSTVEVYESPFTKACEAESEDLENFYSIVFEKTKLIAKNPELNRALSVDPIFEHAGLGRYYVIATK